MFFDIRLLNDEFVNSLFVIEFNCKFFYEYCMLGFVMVDD